jgi:hypothetical protein
MKAQGVGASEIAKALKIGRASVYRFWKPDDPADGADSKGSIRGLPRRPTWPLRHIHASCPC